MIERLNAAGVDAYEVECRQDGTYYDCVRIKADASTIIKHAKLYVETMKHLHERCEKALDDFYGKDRKGEKGEGKMHQR